MLSGGGTGGHITPILSVAHDIKRTDQSIRTIYVGERKGKFDSLLSSSDIDDFRQIFAGKFRRYHGESLLRRLFDVKTITLNIRDFFFFLIGCIQAFRLLRSLRPDAVFLKGGFVGVPVGIAAGLLKIPLITHDSDAVAGLANRLVARWVSLHLTAFPIDSYPYDSEKTEEVGVIVSSAYRQVTPELRQSYKKQLGVPSESRVLLITGGSTGAVAVNKAIEQLYKELFDSRSDLYIIHQTGKGKAGELKADYGQRLQRFDLLDPMHVYSGAADVIIMRAGANTLAEFAVQAKACIVIPSPHLPGAHQTKNAQHLADKEAVVLIKQYDEHIPVDELRTAIADLLDDSQKRSELSGTLHQLAHEHASVHIAKTLIDMSKNT